MENAGRFNFQCEDQNNISVHRISGFTSDQKVIRELLHIRLQKTNVMGGN